MKQTKKPLKPTQPKSLGTFSACEVLNREYVNVSFLLQSLLNLYYICWLC